MATVTEDTVLSEVYGDFHDDWRPAIGGELHRIEGICRRAALGQAEAVRLWRAVHLLLGTATVLTGGVAGSLMLAGTRYPLIAGALALVAALLATLGGMVGPARREAHTGEAAKGYQTVEALTRQARQVDLPRLPFEPARRALAELTEQWQGVNRLAPAIPRWAQRRADRYPEPYEESLDTRVSDVVRVFRVWPRTAADDLE